MSYIRSSSRVPRVPRMHRAPCIDETDAPIHPASSVDTFDTKAFLSRSSLVTGSAGYQEINRRFVRILDITSPNETERTPVLPFAFRVQRPRSRIFNLVYLVHTSRPRVV